SMVDLLAICWMLPYSCLRCGHLTRFATPVDVSSAPNASTRTHLGVSDRGAKELATSGVVVSGFHASHDLMGHSVKGLVDRSRNPPRLPDEGRWSTIRMSTRP